MELLIVTGHSGGLGRQILEAGRERKMALIGLSRRQLGLEGTWVQELAIDLSQTRSWEDEVVASLQRWPQTWSRVVLVNNAGTVAPIASLEQTKSAELDFAFRLNVTAPLRLVQTLLRYLPATIPLRIANISSGAATKPYEGWTAYCSTKAALRMQAMVLAQEMATAGRDVRVLVYEPGVIDTPMQQLLRGTESEVFPSRQRFVSLFEQGQLIDPRLSAEFLLKELNRAELDYFTETRYVSPAIKRT